MTDYNFLLEIRLSSPQFQTLNYISRVATSQGLNIYLVGGAVRDVTLGQSAIRDLNFVTEGSVQKIFRALSEPTARKHAQGPTGAARPPGTLEIDAGSYDARRQQATLQFANGVKVDIAAARREVYSKPGRPAQTFPAGIFDDLRRRDFSVNAMAISLHPNSRGLLLDPTNGAADIETRELRALNSRTFFEDPSRIYRLLRLSLRLGFKIEERTQAWLEAALQERTWEWMSAEQQARELRDLLQEENPWRMLRVLADRGITAGLDRSLAKVHIDRLEKVRPAPRLAVPTDPFVLHFDNLTAKLPSAQKKKLAQKVMPDAKTLKLALSLEGEAHKLVRMLGSDKGLKPSGRYQFLETKPQPLLLYTLAHYPQATVQKPLKDFLFKYPQLREKLPRAELQAMGVEAGPHFEKIMNALFFAMMDGDVRSHPQMMKALREFAGVKEAVPAKQPQGRAAEKEEPKRTRKTPKAGLSPKLAKNN
jgi:tRNA nucleotidyltransferase (CCA-adding enzyme)